jgi:hypothetical protein
VVRLLTPSVKPLRGDMSRGLKATVTDLTDGLYVVENTLSLLWRDGRLEPLLLLSATHESSQVSVNSPYRIC